MGALEVTALVESSPNSDHTFSVGAALTPSPVFDRPGPKVRLCIDSTVPVWDPIASEPTWVQEVTRQLELLFGLQPGWDGGHASTPSMNAIRAAIELLSLGLSPSSPAPALVPTPDGGLQLEWHLSRVEIEIYLDPSGQASGWGSSKQSGEWEQEIISPWWSSRILKGLLDDTKEIGH